MDRHLHEDLFQQMKMNREMFEGKEYPTQWALNPSTYQNMSNDQVDWAALAQQWIKMKEVVVPPAPPPPSLSNNSLNNDEHGEAPMDMDTKDDDVPPAPPAPNISGNDNNWSQWSQWGQWNAAAPGGACWEWSGVPPPGVQIGPDGRPMGNPTIIMPTVPPAPNISGRSGFNHPPPGTATTATSTNYNFNSVGGSQVGFNQVPGYWTSDHLASMHQAPFLKGIRHNNRLPAQMRNDLARGRDEKEKTPDDDSTMVIDAAKRRQLPAWIREGLEKMERQKHRAVERERQEMLRNQEIEARKIAEEEARAVLNPSKSKFDSDSEKELDQDSEERVNEEERNNPGTSPEIVVRQRKSRFRDAVSPDARLVSKESPPPSQSIVTSPIKRSREEILQDNMLKVRRSLTEILLEVTNEEIASICKEVWSRARNKAPAGNTPVASFTKTAPIAQITRELGLGIYGDSNSESEEEADNQAADNNDSDMELKETLKRRQAAFKKTEEEIEARLAEDEENELRGNEEHANSKYDNHTSNDMINKTSVDERTVNNERDNPSETQSSEAIQTPRRHQQLLDNNEKVCRNNTPSRSIDTATSTTITSQSSSSSSPSVSSSSTSSSSSSSDADNDLSYTNSKKNRKRKERSRSLSRTTRSKKSRSKTYSSSRKVDKKQHHQSERKKRRRTRSRSDSRSKSRRRTRSRSRRQSRERKRSRTRSRSRERRRSRSYGYSKRRGSRSRTKSRERRRSRSKSRGHRDGKKSSRRYKD